jgi:Zn-dependent protease
VNGGDLETFLYLAPVILVSLVLHELAHALVATRYGDPTPREQGRLTLNPIPHLDPFGTAMFAITYFTSGFMFGWARPVMVNTNYLRRPQQQMAVIAAAGPATNFVLAVAIAAFILHGPLTPFSEADTVLQYAYQVNVVLGIFNLLPIPPLDGSRIVAAAMNEATYTRWSQLDQYGFFVIFGVIIVFNEQWSTFLGSALDHTTEVIVRLVGG